MIIKLLDIQDVYDLRKSIYDFLKMCFLSTYGKTDHQLIEAKLDGLIEYIKAEKAYVFGAFTENDMTGFLWGYQVDTPFDTVFHIAYIAVCEKGRRQGVGKNLIKVAEAKAKEMGIQRVELLVGANNRDARNFYANIGYEIDKISLSKFLE